MVNCAYRSLLTTSQEFGFCFVLSVLFPIHRKPWGQPRNTRQGFKTLCMCQLPPKPVPTPEKGTSEAKRMSQCGLSWHTTHKPRAVANLYPPWIRYKARWKTRAGQWVINTPASKVMNSVTNPQSPQTSAAVNTLHAIIAQSLVRERAENRVAHFKTTSLPLGDFQTISEEWRVQNSLSDPTQSYAALRSFLSGSQTDLHFSFSSSFAAPLLIFFSI